MHTLATHFGPRGSIVRGLCFAVTLLSLAGTARAGTLVSFNTNFGTIKVDLFDDVVGPTVQNFITAMNGGYYTDTIIHRSVNNFVIQGGGFDTDFESVGYTPATPLELQYQILNRRGTIAMARSAASNSASSQFYFNTADNSTTLAPNATSAGYAAFGWIVSGLDVMDAMAAIPRYNAGGVFNELPLQNYPGSGDVLPQHLLIIHSVTIDQQHPSFQNPINSYDTNNDGNVNASDALVVINSLLQYGAHDAAGDYIGNTYKYFDTNGNGRVNASDALAIINTLIAQQASPQASALAMTVPEPSSLVMLATAGAALAVFGWRRRCRK